MALAGTFKKHTNTPHPTETFDVVRTEPDGTKKIITEPVQIESVERVENVYVNIRTIVIYADYPFMHNGDPTKMYRANITFRIYPNKEARDENPNMFLDESVWTCSDFDISKDSMAQSYLMLKENVKGFDELIDA